MQENPIANSTAFQSALYAATSPDLCLGQQESQPSASCATDPHQEQRGFIIC